MGMVGATVLALGLSAPMASAQPRNSERAATDQRARELFQKGDTAYAEGRYEEALAAFQESYDISGRPQLLFNISNALERLGRYQEAVDALEKYLASGKARDRDVVQKRLAAVKKRAEEQKREEEKKAKEEEELKAREAEEKKRADALAAQNAQRRDVDRQPAKEPPPKPILPYVLVGGGGVLFVTGAVFGVLTLGARSDAKNGCTDGPSGKRCGEDVSDALSKEKTFGLVADIGMLSGLVVGGIGVYMLLTNKSPVEVTPKAQARDIRFVSRPGGGGVEVVGTF